jgi:hypothetical protein
VPASTSTRRAGASRAGFAALRPRVVGQGDGVTKRAARARRRGSVPKRGRSLLPSRKEGGFRPVQHLSVRPRCFYMSLQNISRRVLACCRRSLLGRWAGLLHPFSFAGSGLFPSLPELEAGPEVWTKGGWGQTVPSHTRSSLTQSHSLPPPPKCGRNKAGGETRVRAHQAGSASQVMRWFARTMDCGDRANKVNAETPQRR